ncbi:SDR family NAD(P)-dependent oxidoreductase [Pedococcus sp. 5OH_020]|uniref:SDR family NAD(P)-dependent oxidoreductase n=1 Tax=Pedococcus sp. 5OH_020 TaxID=2989814 RepID=UPI0022E9D081|nr:SDR family NAD(P)-dependent oxidoreductase [Pedococcus sp. 5OH_020]
MHTALVTGGSAGLGLALTRGLALEGWHVVSDGRHHDRLAGAASTDPGDVRDRLIRVAGDVTDAEHRRELSRLVALTGRLDLLVHNASTLGQTPLPALAEVDLRALAQVWETNVAAPLALTQALLPLLRGCRGVLLSISSDAAVAHYEGWGAYGASKAALDHLTLTLGVENPELAVYAVDPGDMRTAMHQAAFPGEDISDRPPPESVVPQLLELLRRRPASGRYRAADLRTGPAAAASEVQGPPSAGWSV